MAQSKQILNGKRAVQGFTLIEILVAIAIFAALSISAYQVLNQMQRSNQQSIERTQRLKAIQRALVLMDNDFQQMALRQFRHHGEEPSALLLLAENGLLESDSQGILFTRLGWQNPQQMFPRGEVSKVGYRIRNEMLERVWWRYPDTPAGQEGDVTPLLEDTEALELRFYAAGSWSEQWNTELALPQAVGITLTLKDFGRIEKIYLTAGSVLQNSTVSQDHTNG
ncbi:type II secretion system protein GspJ [Vibrio sp. HA2012]|uniref:type II secretion system minor pseudopilin GspJ n=1 Tax=Vibrio sp. HA2012 TaxID=1971595 RepID=UPI000C2BF2F3|nr:type II secretion system minor pseudopilin GspJ [Vibrio sp. HA2012]PJC85082.1 type II secretion system protein GspJ [Vibrio sp. HA2012]